MLRTITEKIRSSYRKRYIFGKIILFAGAIPSADHLCRKIGKKEIFKMASFSYHMRFMYDILAVQDSKYGKPRF